MAISKLVFNELNKQDWPLIIKKSTAYAATQFKFWGLLYEKGIKGYSPQDIVLEGIEKIYSGEWKWNPSKSNLSYYLNRFVIRGLVANLARNEEVKKSDSVSLEDLNCLEPVKYSKDDIEQINLIINFIEHEIGDDDQALKIFKGLSNGFKRREICDDLGINTLDYANAYKRYQRIIKKINSETIRKLLP